MFSGRAIILAAKPEKGELERRGEREVDEVEEVDSVESRGAQLGLSSTGLGSLQGRSRSGQGHGRARQGMR